jgi:hypothetical protein
MKEAKSARVHTSAYVSMRQHTSAYVSIRQHTCRQPVEMKEARSARGRTAPPCPPPHRCVSICTVVLVFSQYLYFCTSKARKLSTRRQRGIRQHTSAYVSIRQHTSADLPAARGAQSAKHQHLAACSSSSGVSICTFVPVSNHFCTSKASEQVRTPAATIECPARAALSSSAVSMCTFVLANQVLVKQVK